MLRVRVWGKEVPESPANVETGIANFRVGMVVYKQNAPKTQEREDNVQWVRCRHASSNAVPDTKNGNVELFLASLSLCRVKLGASRVGASRS